MNITASWNAIQRTLVDRYQVQIQVNLRPTVSQSWSPETFLGPVTDFFLSP
jgi:hypothetical protein